MKGQPGTARVMAIPWKLEELRFRLNQMKKDTRSIKGMEAAKKDRRDL